MYRHPRRLWRGAPDPLPAPSLLVPPCRGGDRKKLSWVALQRVQGGHTGRPPTPTIYNVVFDASLCHFVAEVAGEEAGLDGFGRAGGKIVIFFYAYGGLLYSTRAEQL